MSNGLTMLLLVAYAAVGVVISAYLGSRWERTDIAGFDLPAGVFWPVALPLLGWIYLVRRLRKVFTRSRDAAKLPRARVIP